MTEDRLKIAVFIDFDNIEIGVRNTLNRTFDISAVLEAVKERGEIVTKVAYGDWKRSGDYGRAMGQHAIHMVQRNPTPGGDKNGADINLALDALEMAFTRDHINAFVIVGGDSDFMTLVEKLKQYDKKVIVVGGRGFTSVILQKNCHEFIAYENLIRSGRKPSGRARSAGEAPIEKAEPLVLRALKILADREVSPQIGLLKSTLLQLDSTFSERDYGATTFRDFVEKLARTRVISLKHMDRSIVVESGENGWAEGPEEESAPTSRDREPRSVPEVAAPPPPPPENGVSREAPPAGSERLEEGIAVIRSAFEKAEGPLRWPMYLRSAKQLIRSYDPDFDEANYGFRGLQDALRHVQKAGVLRLERNRQGVLRILPGEELSRREGRAEAEPAAMDSGAAPEAAPSSAPEMPDLPELPIEAASQAAIAGAGEEAEAEPQGRRRTAPRATARKAAGAARTGTRKTASGRSTKTTRKKFTRKAAKPEPGDSPE